MKYGKWNRVFISEDKELLIWTVVEYDKDGRVVVHVGRFTYYYPEEYVHLVWKKGIAWSGKPFPMPYKRKDIVPVGTTVQLWNCFWENMYSKLTIGKKYEVIESREKFIHVINDNWKEMYTDCKDFIPV